MVCYYDYLSILFSYKLEEDVSTRSKRSFRHVLHLIHLKTPGESHQKNRVVSANISWESKGTPPHATKPTRVSSRNLVTI